MNNNIFKHVRIPERLKKLKEKFDSNCIFDHEEKILTYTSHVVGLIEYNILLNFYKDYLVNVNGNIYLDNQNLNSIDVKFGKVTYCFNCSDNNLVSLKNCPEYVGGFFNCSFNKLENLKHCPEYIGDFFYCHRNKLETLEHCPKIVKKSFDCSNNFKQFTIEEVKEKCKVGSKIYI